MGMLLTYSDFRVDSLIQPLSSYRNLKLNFLLCVLVMRVHHILRLTIITDTVFIAQVQENKLTATKSRPGTLTLPFTAK